MPGFKSKEHRQSIFGQKYIILDEETKLIGSFNEISRLINKSACNPAEYGTGLEYNKHVHSISLPQIRMFRRKTVNRII